MERIILLVVYFVLVDSVRFSEHDKEYEKTSVTTQSTSPCIDHNHMFLVPGVLTSGAANRVCISRFYPEGTASVFLTLTSDNYQTAVAARDLTPGDGGCIDILVPQLPSTKAELSVVVKYPEKNCQWSKRLSIRVGSGRVVTIYTERMRYTPGDGVHARILVLKPDLTPAHNFIDEIWLEGPHGAWNGARAAEWKRVRTRLGIAQVHHILDEFAPPGKWTIRARLTDGSQGAAAFQVGSYDIPPFQLSVKHAPKVLRTSDRLVWTVCVRYPWTEAVEGMLVIRIRGAGFSGSDSSPSIRTAVRLRAPRACHRHAAATRRIKLGGANLPDVVIADFSFQEDGTRIWQNTTVVSKVVDKPVTLEFVTEQRSVISPGLPYRLMVKATRWDDKPAVSVRVNICRTPIQAAEVSADGECFSAKTDENGVVNVMFTAGEDVTVMHKFEATLQNDTSIFAIPILLPVYRSGALQASLGSLKTDLKSPRTFVPLYLNSRNITRAITVHFLVITRGGVIYRWGATSQCPITNFLDQIQTAPRNAPCPTYSQLNKLQGEGFDNSTDALLNRHLLRIMLPVKVSHQMCPDSHMIAYFYYHGEFVTTSRHFKMEECFVNKVEATWASRQTAPGSYISLHLHTQGPALCALTALDSAAKWHQPMETVQDALLNSLKKIIDGHRNLTEYDAAGDCFLTSDASDDSPTTSPELTAIWLAAAGVRVVGGSIPTTRSCPTIPLPLTSDDVTVPRSDFSEAWLWRLVAIGSNGSITITAETPDSITRYEASAVCISKNGVAVTTAPAVLQVFREFFIHADGPERLRRGDSTIIRYRIFNYLYENLSVQIQILMDPHLEGPLDFVESVCVRARASIARRVEVRAKLAGNARVSVRAKSVRDSACGNLTTSDTGASDEVIIQMVVEPEGVPVEDQRSMLLCAQGSPESSTSEQVWNWPPAQIIPGTDSLTVWAIADITGPLLADADSLLLLPRGCGEQNMARMATNLLAMKQLDSSSTAAALAREHVARGFTRQLQYVHPQGGFSAFGAQDATPSTWLTAFVIRYLRKAHYSLTPDLPTPPALDRAERWLFNQQMENGCFRNEGQVFHRELRGGLNEDGEIASVALTAYVITSLIESHTLSSRILQNALSCLRALPPLKTKTPTRVYGQSLLAYAYMRLKRYEEEVRSINEATVFKREEKPRGLDRDEEMMYLLELLKLAKRNREFVWWETGSLATSIEATGYALLALAQCPVELRESSCANDARGAIRWLSTHRNPVGGFVSTQDTLVALEALSVWKSVHLSSPTNLTVSVRSDNNATSATVQHGARVPTVMKMKSGNYLNVKVEGTGCAVVQATRSFHTYAAYSSWHEVLSLEVAVHTDGSFHCNGSSCYCAAVIEACVLWTGNFPEMALLEIALPGGYTADAERLYSQLNKINLLRRIELSPSGSKAVLYLGTRDGSSTLGNSGHQCYNIHAVGPRVKTKPAYARIMDYYKPTVNDTQMFSIPEDCPSRIANESHEYVASDNLFNRAKSLTDDKEIIINTDFSFDDIPEGIPLDDPIYDNLMQASEKDRVSIKTSDADRLKYVELPENKESEKVYSKPEEGKEYDKRTTTSEMEERKNRFNKYHKVYTVPINYDPSLIHALPQDVKVDQTKLNSNAGSKGINRENVLVTSKTEDDKSEFNRKRIEFENKKQDEQPKAFIASVMKSGNSYFGDDIMVKEENQKEEKLKDENQSGYLPYPHIPNVPKGSIPSIPKETKHMPNLSKGSMKIPSEPRETKFKNPKETEIIVLKGDMDTPELNQEAPFRKREPYGLSGKLTDFNNDRGSHERESKSIDNVREREIKSVDNVEAKDPMEMGAEPETNKDKVDNPKLSNFHTIDSETDLAVPDGIEGPIPSIVTPPPSFIQTARAYVIPSGNPYVTRLQWSFPNDRAIYVIS